MGQRKDTETHYLPFAGPENPPASRRKAPEGKLPGRLVPQADNPALIIRLVEFLSDGAPVDAQSLGIDERQVDYYFVAAEILQLVSKDKQLLPAGRALRSLDSRARNARLALAFAESECGRAWAASVGVKSLLEVPRGTAQQFIDEEVNLGGETIERRADSLKAWFAAWMPYHPQRWQHDSDTHKGRLLALEHTAVFDSHRSLEVVQALGPGTSLLRCATGYLSVNGYKALIAPLDEITLQLLVGYEVAFPSVEKILERFRQSIDEGAPTRSKEAAIRNLHQSVAIGRTQVRGLDPRYKPRLHAKLYLFDEYAAYVTSANLSENGLRNNIEDGYVVREAEPIRYFRMRFDELFGRAEWLTRAIIHELEDSWVFAPVVQPYLFYLKVLFTLIPGVPDLSKKTQRRLAAFQGPIVGETLHSLRESRGCLMVSPTGTGKTVMACYIARALVLEGRVDRVFVLCPTPRLRDAWKKEISQFGISAEVITHGIVQGKGKPREGTEARLQRCFSEMRGTDLLIIDECHAFRNEETNGYETLRELVGARGDPNKPQLLLLSATPMSRDIGDLNALLLLIEERELESITDLLDARRVVNVTLPLIIKQFGTDGRGGRGTGLVFGDKLWYFGRIRVRTAQYTPEDAIFEYISKMDLQFRRATVQSEQARRPAEELEDGEGAPSSAIQLGFIRLILMRRAESSPRALLHTIDRCVNSAESWVVPADAARFRERLLALRELASSARQDRKLAELVSLLKERFRGRRVLVFSYWTTTVEYLVEELQSQLGPEARIAKLTGAVGSGERGHIIKRFAPTAQNQNRPRRSRRDDIDILVATDAIAEGENLQDADVVINYELTWTPLLLIQRVGRVDRPTKEVRDIEVWNFFPGTPLFEEQLGLLRKLKERSELYERMTRTKVVGDDYRDLALLEDRALGLVREFYKKKEGDFQELREAFVQSSTYLADRAGVSPADIKQVEQLPIGVRSCMRAAQAGIFALLKTGPDYRCVFWPSDGSPAVQSSSHPAHEQMLRYVKAPRDTPLVEIPQKFQEDLERHLEEWMKEQGLEEDSVTVICSAALTKTPDGIDAS